MPVNVLWDDENTKTIIRCDYVGKWTWDDVFVAMEEVNRLIANAPHPVSIIHNLIDSVGIPGRAITQARKFTEMLPQNWDLSVVVGSGLFAELLVNVFGKLYRKLGQHYRTAPNLDKARALIAEEQTNKQ